jgi:mannitol/fructose-specific phosphotransferase system IIA component (Ntr-type)
MALRDFFRPECVLLDLAATGPAEVLVELVRSLGLDEKSESTLIRTLQRREELGTTGVGRGIAIPHGRSLVVNRVRLAYGRSLRGIDYRAIDGRPVHHFFLIVAPPIEVNNQYLPVLGKVAQFAKELEGPDRLMALPDVEGFFALLDRAGA